MQRMWEKIHPEMGFKETRAHPHGREALQVRRVWEIFHPIYYPQGSSASPRWSEESRVWRVQKEIYKESKFKVPHAHSRRRYSLPMSSLSQEIQPQFDLEETRPENATRTHQSPSQYSIAPHVLSDAGRNPN